MRVAGNEAIDALEERIAHHEKCRFAYVSWKYPLTLEAQEELKRKHIRPAVSFEADGHEIYWRQTLWFEDAEDSKDGKNHVCYKSTITVDGVKKDIRAIKKAMDHLARNSVDAMRKTAHLVKDGKLKVSA
jgi:hypothetical protein